MRKPIEDPDALIWPVVTGHGGVHVSVESVFLRYSVVT
jgi:hypothetical protein